jgi:hypothetical protein
VARHTTCKNLTLTDGSHAAPLPHCGSERIRFGPAILKLLDVSNDIVFSQRLRKEAVFVQMSVTKQFCRRTGQKPAKLLKGLNWGLSTDKSADDPREPPNQQPNNLHKREREGTHESELSPLFEGLHLGRGLCVRAVRKCRGQFSI